jgi:hypothetical protein
LALIAEQGWDQDYRAVEFWIVLKDGRTFGFMAATPEYLRDYLDRENLLSFVSLGLLVVSQITEQALLDALENSLSQATRYEVDSLGYRMSSSHNHSDEDDNYTP